MPMLSADTLRQALAAFHDGLRAGTGATETFAAGAPTARLIDRPYVRALAAAGLGGVMLAASPGPAPLAGPTTPPPVISLERTDAVAPDLALFGENLAAFNPKADYVIVDTRTPEETRGLNLPREALEVYKAQRDTLVAKAMIADKADVPGLALSAASNDRPYVCTVVTGGGLDQGDLRIKVARIAGLYKRDAAGLQVENNQTVVDPDRIAIRMSLASHDNMTAFHEMGHCSDAAMLPHLPEDTGDHALAYRQYLLESYADTFATIMMARAEGHTRTPEEWADWRILATVLNGASQNMSTRSEGGEVVDNGGAHYYTTPSIDAAVDWINRIGIERLRALSPEQIVARTRALVDATALTPQAHQVLTGALLDTGLERGALGFSPHVPQAVAQRFARAAKATGYQPQAGDVPDAPSAPSAPQDAESAWQVRLPARLPAGTNQIAEAEQQAALDHLAADRAAGVRVTGVDRKGSSILVSMQERNGLLTRALVSRDGDVVRYADGKRLSLSDDRPAVQHRDGSVEHGIERDGHYHLLTGAEWRDYRGGTPLADIMTRRLASAVDLDAVDLDAPEGGNATDLTDQRTPPSAPTAPGLGR